MAKRSLRKLSRDALNPKEDRALFYQEAMSGSDRSAAIMMGAIVENALGSLITLHLKRRDKNTIEALYERDGPLSTFFSVINLAYAMGLINKPVSESLHSIRRIRNVFAHSSRPHTFATREIGAACTKIKVRYREPPLNLKIIRNPRDIYVISSAILAARFSRLSAARSRQAAEKAKRRIKQIEDKITRLKALQRGSHHKS